MALSVKEIRLTQGTSALNNMSPLFYRIPARETVQLSVDLCVSSTHGEHGTVRIGVKCTCGRHKWVGLGVLGDAEPIISSPNDSLVPRLGLSEGPGMLHG